MAAAVPAARPASSGSVARTGLELLLFAYTDHLVSPTRGTRAAPEPDGLGKVLKWCGPLQPVRASGFKVVSCRHLCLPQLSEPGEGIEARQVVLEKLEALGYNVGRRMAERCGQGALHGLGPAGLCSKCSARECVAVVPSQSTPRPRRCPSTPPTCRRAG